MGRQDNPSGSEDDEPARAHPARSPARKVVVKQERLEIVGMDGDQETAPPQDEEHALRAQLLKKLEESPRVKRERRSRSRSRSRSRERRSRSRSRDKYAGRDRDRERERDRGGERERSRGREGSRDRDSKRSPPAERKRRWHTPPGDSRAPPRDAPRPGPAQRPGDWTCPRCGANVFASKNECFKCRTPKPPATFTPGGYGEGDTGAARAAAAAADSQSGRAGRGKAFACDPSQPLIRRLASRAAADWAPLPVLEYRKTIIDMVKRNQVVVLTGETGSGKTTQIPQYLAAEAGWTGRIGVTQPRRVAAVSVAKRVAEEVGVKAGDEVGYAIRFEDITGPNTAIKFLTDGILLRELLSDRLLSTYGFVMLDEAHERSLHTDILFALIKQVLVHRPEFRLMVCSATLDTSKFSEYFFNAPMLDVPGRAFPVEIQYMECNRYVDKIMELVDQLHVEQPVEHHILVFLTGEDEIIRACQGAHRRILQRQQDGEEVAGMRICPLHSSLPVEFYQRVFDEPPTGTRKLVVATNIAETSITVPGIKFVIDCGAVKQKVFSAETGMESLNIMPVSKPAAKQRSGRAGRTGPGARRGRWRVCVCVCVCVYEMFAVNVMCERDACMHA